MRLAIVGLVVLLGGCISTSAPKNGATVTGTVQNTQGSAISNATVTITPTGASALVGVTTAGDGTYTVDNVPAGDGSVTVSNTPSNCAPTATAQYTGVKNGGHRIMNLVVGCN